MRMWCDIHTAGRIMISNDGGRRYDFTVITVIGKKIKALNT